MPRTYSAPKSGLRQIAQVDLEEHHNQHQPLAALAPMALTVLATVLARAQRDERATFGAPIDVLARMPLERPPLAGLAQAAVGELRSDRRDA